MADETSNTGSNRKPGTFQKGDARINRKGRPRSFDALRKMAQKIAVEDAGDMTRIELIMRAWSLSKNPTLQQKFIEYAYGKVPDLHEVTGKDGGDVKHIIEVVYVDKNGSDA
jgi:hypothetical protein